MVSFLNPEPSRQAGLLADAFDVEDHEVFIMGTHGG